MIQNKIDSIIDFLSKSTNITFDGERYIIDESLKPIVDSYKIPYEEFGSQLRLKIKKYFFDEKIFYFEDLESEIKSSTILTPFLTISKEGTIFSYTPYPEEYIQYGKENENDFKRFKNIISYYKLFNHFKSIPFCDYHNSANDEVIFYSSINGIIKVKYDVIPAPIKSEEISLKVDRLLQLAKSIEVSPFFKNALYTISSGTGILNFIEVLKQSDEIISITQRDYELISKKFDFEKFRDSLYKEKEKYFLGIREIIGKIFSQAIGIPISISASVFATYKVSDNSFLLILILLAYSLYVGFYIKIQTIYKSDLQEIEKDFLESFQIITTKSGLPIPTINNEKEKIKRKIDSTKEIITWSIWLVILLALLVALYIIYAILFSEIFSFVNLLSTL